MIEERIGVHSSELRLLVSFKSKPIEPEDILIEIGVEVDNTVWALLRARAGSLHDTDYAYSRALASTDAQLTLRQWQQPRLSADGTADPDE